MGKQTTLSHGENASLIKPIFIVGLHRTGSTLLKNMLNLNPNVAMATDEMDLYNPWHKTFMDQFNAFDDLCDDSNLFKLIDFIFNGNIRGTFWKDYKELGIQRKKIFYRAKNSDRSLKSIISILLDEYRLKNDKNRVGAKYPLHFSRIKFLYEWYPDAKVIFLTRDARAICASKVNDEATRRRKAKSKLTAPLIQYVTLLFFVLEYMWSATIYKRFRRHVNFYKIRYEDLVTRPDDYVKEMCAFCEIPFDPEMMNVIGKPSSHTGEVARGFDKTRISNWQNRLSRFDKWLITTLTKSSMNELGYVDIDNEYTAWLSEHR